MIESTGTQGLEQVETSPQRPICCKKCGKVVSNRADSGSKTMGDEHTFRNPAGYSFHVLLFSQAKGCITTGPAVSEASWFPGFSWKIALCRECQTHLGWRFENRESSFYGLIVTRLSGL